MNYSVRFHGGPLTGKLRAYPRDPGPRIVLPCENGGDVVYQRDMSTAADVYMADTGANVYECVLDESASSPVAKARGID